MLEHAEESLIINIVRLVVTLSAIVLTCPACTAAEPIDIAEFVQQKGWRLHESRNVARSPTAEVAPVMFYDKGNSVPSCGLIVADGQKRHTQFIELVGSEPGANFPQCVSIASMVPFKLRHQDYIAVEYVSRETREDIERGFFYLRRDPIKGYIADEALTEAVPSTPADVGAVTSPAAKRMDGVMAARVAQIARTLPQWRLIERDFISEAASSFATLERKETQQCLFVAEAGAAAAAFTQTEFAPASTCVSVLASSRLDRKGMTYYLAIFKAGDSKQEVAVISVSVDGKITAERLLAEAINRSGSTDNIKSAKAALFSALK